MALTTTYTINSTQGDLSFTINVGGASGPFEVIQQNGDLTFYGYGRTGWGQEVDQNFYRLLENFACAELTAETASTEATPKSKVQLGGALGINVPIRGQHWYNITTSEMYVCSDPETNSWKHLISKDYADARYVGINNDYVRLDGSNTPLTGPFKLQGAPTDPAEATTKAYVDGLDAAATAFNAATYLDRTGDDMSGGLLIKGVNIPGFNNDPALGPHLILRATGSEGGSTTGNRNVVLGMGATDGALCSPHIDFHTSGSNIDYDTRIIASGGTSISGQGTLELIGVIKTDGRVPMFDDQIVTKKWTEDSIAAAVLSNSGTNISTYLKKTGDTMVGSLNMGSNPLTNLKTPTNAADAVRKDYVDQNAYMPSGLGSHSITISTASPSGGVDGDIWFKV